MEKSQTHLCATVLSGKANTNQFRVRDKKAIRSEETEEGSVFMNICGGSVNTLELRLLQRKNRAWSWCFGDSWMFFMKLGRVIFTGLAFTSGQGGRRMSNKR